MVEIGVATALGMICAMVGVMFAICYVASLFMHVTDHTRRLLITCGEWFLIVGLVLLLATIVWTVWLPPEH